MPSRRERDLAYWMAPRQRSRLVKAHARFHALTAELSSAVEADPATRKVLRARIERERAKMPPGGLSWPFWDLLLKDATTAVLAEAAS